MTKSLQVYRYNFDKCSFICPMCKSTYKKRHTNSGKMFITHPSNRCVNHGKFFGGTELNMLLNKGGEEDVEIIEKDGD